VQDIRLAIKTLLATDGAIAAIVTSGGTTRIYPSTVPQGTTDPTIQQTLITEISDYHMHGNGFGQARIQIDCWAQTADAATNLAGLVWDRLSGYSGILAVGSNSPQEQIDIKGIFHDQGRDDYDATAKLYTRRRDYIVWYHQD
jgi:uncharacterized protein DUF3168